MLILSWGEDLPDFGEVCEIVLLDGKMYFIVKPWISLGFNYHYQAYAVKFSQTYELVVKTPQNLGDHKPVHAVKSYDPDDPNYYIACRFQLA